MVRKGFPVAVAIIVLTNSTLCAQPGMPRLPFEAALWLQQRGNTVVFDDRGDVVDLRLETIETPFVIGDLDVFPKLERLTINFVSGLTNEQFSGAALLNSLKRLSIEGGDVANDAIFRALSFFPNLEQLDLSYSQNLTSLARLGECPRLKRLVLNNNYELNMSTLAAISPRNAIEELTITSQDPFDDGQLAAIGVFRNLKRLKMVRQSSISDQGLRAIASLDQLEDLELHDCSGVSGKFLDALSKLPLRRLVLSDLGLDKSSLQFVAQLRGLKELSILQQGPGNCELDFLKSLTGLKKLELHLSVDGERSLECIGTLTQLEILKLAGINRFPESSFEHITALQQLTEVDLTGSGSLGGRLALDSLSELPRLKTLKMSAGRLRDANWRALTRLQNLEALELFSGTWLADEHLAAFAELKSLKSFRATAGASVTDAGLASLCSLPRLEELGMSGLTKVTGTGLDSLAADSRLRVLYLDGCRNLSPAALSSLRRLPHLEELDLGDCELTEAHLLSLRHLPKIKHFHSTNIPRSHQPLLQQLFETWPEFEDVD